MSEPYSYPQLNDLHRTVSNNPNLKGDIWLERRTYLATLYLYLAYAEAQLAIFEEIDWTELNELATSNHLKYTDLQYRYFSSAIAFYSYSKSCINLIKKLTADKIPSEYEDWMRKIVELRDRLSAHPDEKHHKKIIASKRIAVSSEGFVDFQLLNLENSEEAKKLRLEPRKDFEQLKTLINDIINYLKKNWRL